MQSSPSIADNKVFADTTLLITSKCAFGNEWFGTADAERKCVCESGRTTDRNAATDAGAPVGNAFNLANPKMLCMACPMGKTSVKNAGNTHTCTRCPIGMFGDAGTVTWSTTAANTVVKRAGLAKASCAGCAVGTYGKEHIAAAQFGSVAHAAADVCDVCPVGTYNDETGKAHKSDCNGCGAGAFNKAGLTLGDATDHDAWLDVCTWECDTITNKAIYGLVVNDGIWDIPDFCEVDATKLKAAAVCGAGNNEICTSASCTAKDGHTWKITKGTSTKDWSGVSAGLTEDTADFGTYAAKTGQFNQCVLAATCKAKKLLADPMTKTCVATCPSGLKADGLSQFCVLAKCAANERSVSTVVSAEVKNTGAEDAAQFVPAKVTFTCEKCKAGKTADAAYNYHSDAVGTIAFAVNLMNTQDDAILKGLPSSTVVKNVFAAARYTSTNCLEVSE